MHTPRLVPLQRIGASTTRDTFNTAHPSLQDTAADDAWVPLRGPIQAGEGIDLQPVWSKAYAAGHDHGYRDGIRDSAPPLSWQTYMLIGTVLVGTGAALGRFL